MEGKFRKRSNAVWCPKPSLKPVGVKFKDGDERIDNIKPNHKIVRKSDNSEVIEERIFREKKVTGWVNMGRCEHCDHCEEFHVEDEGVYCLYPRTVADLEVIE